MSRQGGPHQGLAVPLVFFLALFWLLPAMAAEKPAPQEITLKVLGAMDRPVAGAEVRVEARAGKPSTQGPWKTDANGLIVLKWIPQTVDLLKGTGSRDKSYELRTDLVFRVSAPGYSANALRITSSARGQTMANPKLASLNKKAELQPVRQVLVLAKTAELLAGRLAQGGGAPQAREKCLSFITRNRQALKYLGITYAQPAFELKGDMLRMRVKWATPAWGELNRAPFKTRAVMTAGLPLAWALGREVLPLPGVTQADVWVQSEEKPGGDQLAASRKISVVLGAASSAFVDLGKGSVSPRKFVRNNPAVIRYARVTGEKADAPTEKMAEPATEDKKDSSKAPNRARPPTGKPDSNTP